MTTANETTVKVKKQRRPVRLEYLPAGLRARNQAIGVVALLFVVFCILAFAVGALMAKGAL